MKRVFFIVVDQLNGHWEESVKIDGTGLPPVNVAGYHQLGLIPNFSYLINNGLWVKNPWNKKGCITKHGMKYIATGNYLANEYFKPQNLRPCYYDENHTGFPAAAFQNYKRHNNKFVAGIFGCAPWTDDFLSESCYAVYLPTDTYTDEIVLRKYALPWLKETHNWNLTIVYFAAMDIIGDSGCPSYTPKSNNPRSSKHSYIKFLDKLVGEIVKFLKMKNLWEETYLIIASDHGGHLGCSLMAQRGVITNNWFQGHDEPWDCKVWDFKNNKLTPIYSGGPRRITFILSGGRLGKKYRGKYIKEAQIIDVAPTVAHLLDIPFKCEGKSILEGYEIKSQRN